VLVVAALAEQTQLQRPRLDEEDRARFVQALRQRFGFGQSLLRLAELGEEVKALADESERELGDAAPLAEVDPFSAGGERGLRPLVQPPDDREIVAPDASFAALALLERELECAAHVLDSLPLAQAGAGEAADAECPCRLRKGELGRERKRPLGGRDRLAKRRRASPVPQMCPFCVRAFHEQTTTKCQFAGTLAKPSDGLEPSTPSLPCAPIGNWSQPVATVSARLSRS
jgi:hypothetical protein